MLDKVERLIREINITHKRYSADYFETGKVAKTNLAKTIAHVPTEHILMYRLNLHESINDYLMAADLQNIDFFYRVKTSESILDKIKRYSINDDQYPVNNWMNDIFGCRMVLPKETITDALANMEIWPERYGLKNWYTRDKQGYKGIHLYFKNQSNFYYPWELQLWDESDVAGNIQSHQMFKRSFVPPMSIS